MRVVISLIVSIAIICVAILIGYGIYDRVWGVDKYPHRDGKKEVGAKAEYNIQTAYKGSADSAWEDHMKGKIGLKKLDEKLTDQDTLLEAREIIKKNHGGETLQPSSSIIHVTTTTTPATPQPTQNQTQVLVPNGQREPPRQFEVIDPLRHSYQLDARETWRELDIEAKPGCALEVYAHPARKVCSSPTDPCVGPEGTGGMAGRDTFAQLYATPNARYYALIGRWGNDGAVFEIGSHYRGQIPPNTEGKKLQVMANVQDKSDTTVNSGGHNILSVTIQQ